MFLEFLQLSGKCGRIYFQFPDHVTKQGQLEAVLGGCWVAGMHIGVLFLFARPLAFRIEFYDDLALAFGCYFFAPL